MNEDRIERRMLKASEYVVAGAGRGNSQGGEKSEAADTA
jgi:hypothetical protein